MTGAALIGIAYGNALYIRLTQKPEHDAQALRTDTDESDVDLVAGWNISSTA
jgi:hypothetical protein